MANEEKEASAPEKEVEAPKTEKENEVVGEETNDEEENARLAELEAKAVAEATATADASYVPSPASLKADTSDLLLEQVDGLSLEVYNANPSVYMAKGVPVKSAAKLDVPIHVTSGGSVVEYSVSTDSYDIGFAITAEREEGSTIVKENSRTDCSEKPVTGKFLVGSVPCALLFTFDNEYSWFREKSLSYKITVTPPNVDTIKNGRRRRATTALNAIEQDYEEVEARLQQTAADRSVLEQQVKQLEADLEERKKSLEVASEEESWLSKRVELRKTQKELLKKRLEEGWSDEKGPQKGKAPGSSKWLGL